VSQDAARVIAVNLTGTVRGTEFAIKHATRGLTARAQGAGLLVVNTSSTNGLVPADCDLAPVYVATKFGIVGLTRYVKTNARAHEACTMLKCLPTQVA
jgi:NAD(P)-dependent dehydrogenase (short-subunit alcohol dehydrogenase family)